MNIQSTKLPPKPSKPTPAKEDKNCECPDKDSGLVAKTFDFLSTGTKNVLQEGVMAAKNDPALTMRLAATSLSDQILKKVDAPVTQGFERTIVPVMRFALLGSNVARAHRTFNDPLATKVDKGIDAIAVASDLVGAIGGIAMLATSRYAGIGQAMMGFSYAVDVVSHAYRGLNHANDRLKVWFKD